MSIEVFINEWFGGVPRSVALYNPETQDYPRFSTPRTYPEEVIEAIKTGRGVATSVQPYTQKNLPDYLEKLFFDFDYNGDISKAWAAAQDFSLSLYHSYGVSPLIVFSGKKGYHVYAWLQEPYHGTQEELKAVYTELQRMLLSTIEGRSPVFDSQVYGDIARLSRVPYSTHPKSGALCVPVDDNQEPYKLLPGFSEDFRVHGLSPRVVDRAIQNIKNIQNKPQPRPSRSGQRGGKRPCMKAIMGAGSVHGPQHLLKVALVAQLHAEAWDEERIIQVFSNMEGYNESKTRQQVRHALAKGYKPFKCKTIHGLGGCIGSGCPSFGRVNGGAAP